MVISRAILGGVLSIAIFAAGCGGGADAPGDADAGTPPIQMFELTAEELSGEERERTVDTVASDSAVETVVSALQARACTVDLLSDETVVTRFAQGQDVAIVVDAPVTCTDDDVQAGFVAGLDATGKIVDVEAPVFDMTPIGEACDPQAGDCGEEGVEFVMPPALEILRPDAVLPDAGGDSSNVDELEEEARNAGTFSGEVAGRQPGAFPESPDLRTYPLGVDDGIVRGQSRGETAGEDVANDIECTKDDDEANVVPDCDEPYPTAWREAYLEAFTAEFEDGYGPYETDGYEAGYLEGYLEGFTSGFRDGCESSTDDDIHEDGPNDIAQDGVALVNQAYNHVDTPRPPGTPPPAGGIQECPATIFVLGMGVSGFGLGCGNETCLLCEQYVEGASNLYDEMGGSAQLAWVSIAGSAGCLSAAWGGRRFDNAITRLTANFTQFRVAREAARLSHFENWPQAICHYFGNYCARTPECAKQATTQCTPSIRGIETLEKDDPGPPDWWCTDRVPLNTTPSCKCVLQNTCSQSGGLWACSPTIYPGPPGTCP